MKLSQRHRTEGISLTEMLVVLAIVVILMTILVPALSAFAHTSRVIGAADTIAKVFREARYRAMNEGVPTVPVILRDRVGKYTLTYASKAMTFRGVLPRIPLSGSTPPLTYLPATVGSFGGAGVFSGANPQPFSMFRPQVDGSKLAHGAFVYWVGTPTLNIADPSPATLSGLNQAYYEMMYMSAIPPADPAMTMDSSQYTYNILMRGVHNTAPGNFDPSNQYLGGVNSGAVDIYIVETGTNGNEASAGTSLTTWRDVTVPGFYLPDQVAIDQVTGADQPGQWNNAFIGGSLEDIKDGPVFATVTAQARAYYEGSFATGGGVYEDATYFPIFMPVFMPDGKVRSVGGRSDIGGIAIDPSVKSGIIDYTIRVVDTVSREYRYITIRASGQVVVSTQLSGSDHRIVTPFNSGIDPVTGNDTSGYDNSCGAGM